MNKPNRIPLISDRSKYYYLPWEVDDYIERVEKELRAFEQLVDALEFKDIIFWDGELWVLSQSLESTTKREVE